MKQPALPLLARRARPGSFYGWWIAAACGILMFVGVGVGYYGLAVFLRPLRDEHGWSNGVVSGATGLYFSVSGITGALIGPYVDRNGPLRLMSGGIVGLGLAVALIGQVETLWQLYAVYTVLAVMYGLSSAVAVNALMARWFVVRRARAMSIALTGVSAGGAVLAPLGTKLIDSYGLGTATAVMGGLAVVVAVPVIRSTLVWDPAEMGLHPDGLAPAARTGSFSDTVQRRVWSRRDALGTPAFWTILVAFVLVLTAQTGFVLHQISFLEDRFGSRNRAAFALSTTAIGSIIARLIVGTFADRIDKRRLTAALFVVQASAVLAIVVFEGTVVSYLLVLVVGFTIGNIYMMQSLLVAEVFGLVSFGAVFGLISLAAQIGSGLGPWSVGFLEDVTDGYTTPFVLSSILTYIGAAVVLVTPKAAELVDGSVPGDDDDAVEGTVSTAGSA